MRAEAVRVTLLVCALSGCGPRTPAAPKNELSSHPLASFCAEHTNDCDAQYPRCQSVRSPWYDQSVAGAGLCMSRTPRGLVPSPIVQCFPRDDAGSNLWPGGSLDQLIDPLTGHCVWVLVHPNAAKWTPCEELMPVCEKTAGGKCIPGDGPPFGSGGCFDPCDTAADCTDSTRPFCSWMGLSKGGDYYCNGQERVCRGNPLDDCRLR